MSKRYGRNQRRAHRNRIAALEAEERALKNDNGHLYNLARKLRDEIDVAKRIVGEYCVAFEPRTLTMHIKREDYATIMQHDYEHNSGVHRFMKDFDPRAMSEPVHIEQIRLPIMCVLASQDIRGARHCYLAYDGQTYAYAIDPSVWMRVRYPRDVARDVAVRLTNFIYEELSKGMREQQMRSGLTHTRDEPDPRIYAASFRFPPPLPADFFKP